MLRLTKLPCSVARIFRAIARAIKLAGLFLYASIELIITHPSTRPQRADWLHRFCARAMHRMGISLRVEGRYPPRGALISNHLGYLDIVAFAALEPCVFVSKSEIRQWPIVGWMTTMSGTVYVERGRGESALRARSGIQAAAQAGVPLVFFPEGTTTDGSTVLKFHNGILAQVLAANEPLTAAHISYRLTQDNGPGVTVANDVCYWGDVSLLRHIFRLLGLRGIEVSVSIAGAPIHFAATGRKLAAMEARAAVLALSPTTSIPNR